MRDYFIAFDVHCEFTEVAVVNDRGELVQRDRCATTIPALTACLRRVKGNRRLTFEEGPQAGWLWRELRADVAELVSAIRAAIIWWRKIRTRMIQSMGKSWPNCFAAGI